METIFAFFPEYTEARDAVGALLDEGFAENEMHILVQAEIAKELIDISLEEAPTASTDEVGEKRVRGLDAILGREVPMEIPNVGEVYAAGELATMLAKTAASPGTVDGGLGPALIDFGVPGDVAARYARGIEEGGVLILMRVKDEEAPKAGRILRETHADHVGNYPG